MQQGIKGLSDFWQSNLTGRPVQWIAVCKVETTGTYAELDPILHLRKLGTYIL